MYDTAYGILLGRDLHAAYDRYEWSLYQRVISSPLLPHYPIVNSQCEVYYVHVFKKAQHLRYHGLAIPRSAFRIDPEGNELPERRLIKWHYQQCLLYA